MKHNAQDRPDELRPHSPDSALPEPAPEISVAILTGGADKPYAFGLATALISKHMAIDVIANDDLDLPELRNKPTVRFLNLRGEQRSDVSATRKALRVLIYYAKLIRYAAGSKCKTFHILWNNKFDAFDRTLLTLYYILLGKKTVLTVHNVNAGIRDSNDTAWNRLTLRTQYQLAHHLFVHTNKMKTELMQGFGVRETKITVIPFGINNAVPNSCLTPREARQRLGIQEGDKVILFFGNIAPYKGLDDLLAAFSLTSARHAQYRLVIAGRPKNCESYWNPIQESIRKEVESGKILLRTDFIPDEETELYFKAADVFALPYRHVYQSGVLFLGYSFGLPVLAADVGSLKDEVVEGETGFVFKPDNPNDLAVAIERYFSSDMFVNLNSRRRKIRDFASENHSWDVVAQMTINVYSDLVRLPVKTNLPSSESSNTSLDLKVPD